MLNLFLFHENIIIITLEFFSFSFFFYLENVSTLSTLLSNKLSVTETLKAKALVLNMFFRTTEIFKNTSRIHGYSNVKLCKLYVRVVQ